MNVFPLDFDLDKSEKALDSLKADLVSLMPNEEWNFPITREKNLLKFILII